MTAWGNIATGVLSGTIIPSALALVWNVGSSGALIDALGGVTKTKFDTAVASVTEKSANTKNAIQLPSGMIAAFDSDRCPDGWEYFQSAGGRFLVGAGKHSNRSLTVYELRNTGGFESVTLTAAQIPAHKHTYTIMEKALGGLDVDNMTKNISLAPRVVETSSIGGGQPHESRPPYVAVTFCKVASAR